MAKTKKSKPVDVTIHELHGKGEVLINGKRFPAIRSYKIETRFDYIPEVTITFLANKIEFVSGPDFPKK